MLSRCNICLKPSDLDIILRGFVAALEAKAAEPRCLTFNVSNDIALFAKYMVEKYNDNYKVITFHYLYYEKLLVFLKIERSHFRRWLGTQEIIINGLQNKLRGKLKTITRHGLWLLLMLFT